MLSGSTTNQVKRGPTKKEENVPCGEAVEVERRVGDNVSMVLGVDWVGTDA
jgi:hypothetical protein